MNIERIKQDKILRDIINYIDEILSMSLEEKDYWYLLFIKRNNETLFQKL